MEVPSAFVLHMLSPPRSAQALSEKVCSQPQLLQKRELWKRHGLYFENLHKYKGLPSDVGLLDRAQEAFADGGRGGDLDSPLCIRRLSPHVAWICAGVAVSSGSR